MKIKEVPKYLGFVKLIRQDLLQTNVPLLDIIFH